MRMYEVLCIGTVARILADQLNIGGLKIPLLNLDLFD